MLFAVQIGVQQDFGKPDNAVHRCADLVAHIGQKLALGVAGGFGRLLGMSQLCFGFFALRNIHAEADHVADNALRISQRAERSIHDELPATLDYNRGFVAYHFA
ncbi:MAG TPA: hypothetical protein VK686_04490 [Bryobacteraceae bacterium]|nr:hypothetical protein [Bryobacteraceae bacterium]